MACGLKKQNTQEGGVHLTERTCSPYNPIIKQMVDDCLGVPIYLISSIDAIINEDGKTLRLLLEEIQVGVNEGSSDLQETIELIQTFINNLNATYATDAELLGLKGELTDQITELVTSLGELKNRLLAVYNLAQYNTTESYQNETYDRISYPTIVAAVKKLLDDVTRLSQGEYPEVELVNNLKELLLAIANFDEDTLFRSDKWVLFGIDQDPNPNTNNDPNGMLKIIYKILSLAGEISQLDTNVTNLRVIINGNTTDTNSLEYKGSILGKLEDILNQISQLWDWTNDNDFAHLETYADGNAYVKKLAVDEYPVTSAMFATDFETFNTYINTIRNNIDKTYYLYIVPRIILGYEKYNADYDFNGNGYIDVGDVAMLVMHIAYGFAINGNPDILPDEEVNTGDVDKLVWYIHNPEAGSVAATAPDDWGKYIFEIRRRNPQHNANPNTQEDTEYRGPFKKFFEGTNDNFVIIAHPLIPGKIYVDTNTTQTYRYQETSSGRPTMIKVMDLEQLGVPQNGPEMLYLPINPNSSQDSELVVNNPTGVNYNTQKSYEIGISEENFPVNLIAYPYPDDESQLEEGKYYIKNFSSDILTICSFNPTGPATLEGGKYYPEFNIECVTETIDILLGNIDTKEALNVLNDLLFNLNSTLKIKKTEYLLEDKLELIDSITDYIDNALGLTSTNRSKQAIHAWSSFIFDQHQSHIKEGLYGDNTEDQYTNKNVYYIKNGQVLSKPLSLYINDEGNRYSDVVQQVFNFNQDNKVNIEDVTDLIDSLLGAKPFEGYDYSNDSTYAILYKKTEDSIKQIVNKDSVTYINNPNNYVGIKTENRLVKLVAAPSNQEWWRFNGNKLIPIIPNISIYFDKDTNNITLYTGSVPTGSASLATNTVGPDLPMSGDLVVEKMLYASGPQTKLTESTDPFVFGTYDTTANLHHYQDENANIILGTTFILTREELLNLTAPTLEENLYSYLSDTTGYSLMTNPQATPLVVQCEELIDNLAQKCLRTPTNVSLYFDTVLPGYTVYVKTINTALKVFDFKEDATMFTQNPLIYDITKLIYISFNHTAYILALQLSLPNQSVNIKDYFTYTASITFTNASRVIADKEYSFPKYGITLTFKELESIFDPDETWLNTYIKLTGYTGFFVTSNNFITLNPSTFVCAEDLGSSLTLNVSEFLEIPGNEALTLKGKFLSNLDDLSILFISVPGKTITMDPNNPTLLADTWYEYTISNLKCTIR